MFRLYLAAETCSYFRFAVIKSCVSTDCILIIAYYTNTTGMTYLKILTLYEGHLESKERFAIKKYLLIIGKKKDVQVLSHTFT